MFDERNKYKPLVVVRTVVRDGAKVNYKYEKAKIELSPPRYNVLSHSILRLRNSIKILIGPPLIGPFSTVSRL